MRSIGCVRTVLWITLFGSAIKIIATLLLVPRFQMDDVYLGQALSWVADGALTLLLYFALYHTMPQLQKSFVKSTHETAKNEARHGRAFAGLLARYFGK